ncbi:MAG: menaquinone biosynthesis decarboxylase [Bacteroidales bacterium]
MAYAGLNEFVQDLEKRDLLVRIKKYVDPVLEIAEITDRFCKIPGGGKALLFENTGTSFPVLTNLFGSDERIALALGVSNPEEAANDIETIFKALTAQKGSLLDKIRMLPTLHRVSKWMPKVISGLGVCQQIINMSPDLNALPILKTWPYDGGRFVTLPMVITKDPNTGIRNVGMYRMQVFSKDVTGMHWHRHKTGARHYAEYKKRGEQMPIAVALGGDPTYTYSATAPLPDNIDEFLLAGFLRKKPVKLVKGITVDIDVPSDADIIIEGYVDTQEDLAWEGPFGDHTGFYSLADWYPKFHVTCITHKRKAIYPATVVGVPPMEDVYLAKATERIFLSPIKFTMLPEVEDMYLPEEGVAHNIAIVKISKTYPGQAYKVANALWGAGQMMFNKIMVVVDSEVDIRNHLELAKAVTRNFIPGSDIHFGKGPLDVLDHASDRSGLGGKLLVDATEKFPEEIDENQPTCQLADSEAIAEFLSSGIDMVEGFSTSLIGLGLPILLLSVDKKRTPDVNTIAQKIMKTLGSNCPKIMIAVDKEIPLNSISTVIWYMSGNIDAARDCSLIKMDSEGMSCLFINGTRKSFSTDNFPRHWPNIVVSKPETISFIDKKWQSLGLGELVHSPSNRFIGKSFIEGAVLKDV